MITANSRKFIAPKTKISRANFNAGGQGNSDSAALAAAFGAMPQASPKIFFKSVWRNESNHGFHG